SLSFFSFLVSSHNFFIYYIILPVYLFRFFTFYLKIIDFTVYKTNYKTKKTPCGVPVFVDLGVRNTHRGH
ncbi:MAG TPA: hypothetical protein DEV87_06330, partial [Clostridiales bacterium]|nr:hypothetical protein [Clostridiales bacterium]